MRSITEISCFLTTVFKIGSVCGFSFLTREDKSSFFRVIDLKVLELGHDHSLAVVEKSRVSFLDGVEVPEKVVDPTFGEVRVEAKQEESFH